ncbi:MAG: PilZ domain-containing protein [Desulfuromonadaceae bacterium]|nr:PilZ domain-containing protein [Desulfuromonadaceae bacterium]
MTGKKEKVILISGEVQQLLTLDDAFSAREGVDIHVAPHGPDLLKLARELHPDIIFIAPQASAGGNSCCRLLKEDSRIKDIPVVAVVDGEDPEEREYCFRIKPDDILFKPINNHLFLASARRILGLAHRSFYRLQTSLVVQFGQSVDELRVACAYNLSSGGVFIATENPPDLNSRLVVRLSLPTATRPICGDAIVTWINENDAPLRPEMPAGVGVQFLSLNMQDLFAIRSYIDHLQQKA